MHAEKFLIPVFHSSSLHLGPGSFNYDLSELFFKRIYDDMVVDSEMADNPSNIFLPFFYFTR